MDRTLGDPEIDHLAEVLAKNQDTVLRILDCDFCTKEHARKFYRVLRNGCQCIQNLVIRCDTIRLPVALIEALQPASSITHLDIFSRTFCDEGKLGALILRNKGLKSLGLKLTDGKMLYDRPILKAILHHPSIDVLVLNGFDFSRDNQHLFSLLAFNSSIRSLSLRKCNLKGFGLARLSSGMAENRNINQLCVVESMIDLETERDSGLDSMLMLNKTLERLTIADSNISVRFYKRLVQSLQFNDTLTSLTLSMPAGSLAGTERVDLCAKAFLRVLGYNSTIVTLNLMEDVPTHLLHYVKRIVKDNRRKLRSRNVRLRKRERDLENTLVPNLPNMYQLEKNALPYILAKAATHPSYLFQVLSQNSDWYSLN